MYIINNDTLYIYFDGINTLVKEKENEYEFRGNLLKKILNDSCIYYGSSYLGRVRGSKSLLEGKYKLPIIISEKSNILFFPIKGNRCNEIIWFSFKNIRNFKKEDLFVKVDFINSFYNKFMISYTMFNNQMFKCSRLWLIYLTRC